MKIETSVLQGLVNKAIKGASLNKLLPITSLIGIEVKDNELTLVTTNGVNYLYVRENVETEDFYAVIEVEKFAKLVSKTTTKYITLTLTENDVTFKGNGTYHIELPLDENGSPVKYPCPKDSCTFKIFRTVRLSDIQNVLQANKSSLGTALDTPCYTGYYIDNKVYSTNGYVICCLDRDVELSDKPVLISSNMMDLLSYMEVEDIKVSQVDDKLLFTTPNMVVYGTQLGGIEDFNIDEISPLVDLDFDESCEVSVLEMLDVLDRLALFVGPYDKNSVTMTFNQDHIEITSKSSNAVETVGYHDEVSHSPFVAICDILMMQAQLKSIGSEFVTIGYGLDNAIKLSAAEVIKIVALLDSDD